MTRGATATGYGLMSVQGTHTVKNVEYVFAHEASIAVGVKRVKPDRGELVRPMSVPIRPFEKAVELMVSAQDFGLTPMLH